MVVADRSGASVALGENAPDYAYELKETAWGLTDEERAQLLDEVMPEIRDAVVNNIRQALTNG